MSPEKKYSWQLATILILFFVLSLTAVKIGFAQSKNDIYQVDTFDVSGNVSLEVQTSGGSIKAIGSSEDEVTVEMYVRKRGKYINPGKADLDDYDIEISQEGNTIKAHAKRNRGGWNWNDSYSISFVVYTPKNTRSRLRTSGGSLSAVNMTGTQELKTSGGSITTEGIYGDMVLKTSGGSISMTDIQGEVEAKTSGGTINVESLFGSLNVKTSGGSINLDGVEGNVDAKTSGGTINAEILSPADFVRLKTSGGSIRVKVPQGRGYNLDLDGGSVHTKLENFTGETERDEIRGSINGGGTQIYAKTSSGSVSVDYF